MAVTVHNHVLGALPSVFTRWAPHDTNDGGLAGALRLGEGQMGALDLGVLYRRALAAVESYTGVLSVARDVEAIVEVTGRPSLTDAAGGWRPAPTWTELEEWDASNSSWGSDVLDEHDPDPLGRYQLPVGWWQVTGTQGDDGVGEDWDEAVTRVAAYMFDDDPAMPMMRSGGQAHLVRLCGAAGLLGPYCRRGARSVEVL